MSSWARPTPRCGSFGGDSAIAQRSGYAQRVFRDAHPLDDLPGLVDNGNGFRILVGALGLKSLANDNTLLLPPSRTFAHVTNALVGGLNFSFNKYRLETTVTPSLANGIDPALNAPPTAGNRQVEYSVGDYNVENLYDHRDDPFDSCDYDGNTAARLGRLPNFDYAPDTDAEYQARLGLIAQQIVGDLHAPDILLVQEAEDQDIREVVDGAFTCGTEDDADGKPDTLQELALRIEEQSGIAYDAAYDRDGSDDRGIVAALMYRTDRVELLPATADHPVLGSTPDFTYRQSQRVQRADPEPEGAERTAAGGRRSRATSGTASRSTRATRRSACSGSGAPRSASARGSTSTRSRTTSRARRTTASSSGANRRTTSPRSLRRSS